MADWRQPSNSLERWALLTPWIVIVYFSIQLGLRLVINSPLEVDDAEMVGQAGWALGYPNSHPPLYHWIVRICHDLTHSWPAATALPKYALMAVAYCLVYDAARRVTSSALHGAIVVAFLFAIPVVCWKTQTKLTHSILGFAATAGSLHATACILKRSDWRNFAMLGLWFTVGLLAKYNFAFVVVAMLLAALCVSEFRKALASWKSVWAIAIPAALTIPHWLWVRANPALTTENLYRFQIKGGPLGLKLSANSVWDGLISLAVVIAVSIVPVLLACLVASSLFRRRIEHAEGDRVRSVRSFLGWVLVFELVIFIVVVLAGHFAQIHERYLVVLLPPFPLWLALWWKPETKPKAAAAILVAGLFLAVALTIATAGGRIKLKNSVRPVTSVTSTGSPSGND